MTEFLLVGRQAWQKQRPTSERPIYFTDHWGWFGLEAEAEAMVMQRKQHNPRHPTRFLGHRFFLPRGAQWLWWIRAWKRWLSDGCISLHYICTVAVDVRWSLSVLAFFEDIKNPFARFYGAFGYGGELKLCKMWMCVVFCSFQFLINFTGFWWIFETTSRNSVFWRSSLANAGNLRKFQLNSIRTSMITWDPRGFISFLEINSERNQFVVNIL